MPASSSRAGSRGRSTFSDRPWAIPLARRDSPPIGPQALADLSIDICFFILTVNFPAPIFTRNQLIFISGNGRENTGYRHRRFHRVPPCRGAHGAGRRGSGHRQHMRLLRRQFEIRQARRLGCEKRVGAPPRRGAELPAPGLPLHHDGPSGPRRPVRAHRPGEV